MRFHSKGVLFLIGFSVLLMLGVDARWGIAAVVALAVIDGLSFLGPMLRGSGKRESS
jgi:hypothetical protein